MFKPTDNLSPLNEDGARKIKWKLSDILIASIVLGILAYNLR